MGSTAADQVPGLFLSSRKRLSAKAYKLRAEHHQQISVSITYRQCGGASQRVTTPPSMAACPPMLVCAECTCKLATPGCAFVKLREVTAARLGTTVPQVGSATADGLNQCLGLRMLGVVASIFGAAVALSLAQTFFEKGSSKTSSSDKKTAGLPEPDKTLKGPADGNFRAPLWQEMTPQEAAKRAKRWFKK